MHTCIGCKMQAQNSKSKSLSLPYAIFSYCYIIDNRLSLSKIALAATSRDSALLLNNYQRRPSQPGRPRGGGGIGLLSCCMPRPPLNPRCGGGPRVITGPSSLCQRGPGPCPGTCPSPEPRPKGGGRECDGCACCWLPMRTGGFGGGRVPRLGGTPRGAFGA